MTEDEKSNRAVDAALAFMAAEPAFIAIPENSPIIVEYFENHPELSPTEIAHYQQAFHACRDRLRFEHQMSAQEYKTAVVLPIFQRRQQEKPQPSETDILLKEIFEAHGFRDSLSNRAKVGRYMKDHNIDDFSPNYLEHLGHAIETVSEYPGLEPSDAAIAVMPSDTYRKYVEQEFRERQAKQPQPKPSERPFGVRSWSEWVHNR
jgi:hypothetical protein